MAAQDDLEKVADAEAEAKAKADAEAAASAKVDEEVAPVVVPKERVVRVPPWANYHPAGQEPESVLNPPPVAHANHWTEAQRLEHSIKQANAEIVKLRDAQDAARAQLAEFKGSKDPKDKAEASVLAQRVADLEARIGDYVEALPALENALQDENAKTEKQRARLDRWKAGLEPLPEGEGNA